MGTNRDFVAGQRGEVGEESSGDVPGYRHGHIVGVFPFRLELHQIRFNIVGVDLPGSPEASGADL